MSINMGSDHVEYGTAGGRTSPSGKRPAHRHHEIELNFVESGRIDLLYGNNLHRLEAGNFCVFWAALPHRITRVYQSTRLYWMTISFEQFLNWDLSDQLLDDILSGKLFMDTKEGLHHQDLINFKRWEIDLQTGITETRKALLLEVEARLLRLWARHIHTTKNNLKISQSDKARKMASYIADHFTDEIKVANIAGAADLHPNYAMGLFKETYGISIGDYVSRYRVIQAQRMLLLSTAKIDQIGQKCGFGSQSQFYNSFKKHTGKSPLQFRKLS